MVHADETKEKMADEHTPLIATVRTAPPRQRYGHHVLRRFCTVALSCSLLALFATFLFVFGLGVPLGRGRHGREPDRDSSWWPWPGNHERKLSYGALKEVLLETPSSEKAAEWQRYYTAGAHLAGQNYSQALWTKERWEEWGISSTIVDYDIYLNRPVDHRLAILAKSEDQAMSTSNWTVSFEASLTEDILEDDPTTGFDTRIPTFHGYSASGNVTGRFVYANYGTYQDYEDLLRAGIDLEGKVVLARYGGIFRGLKVKRAQELGAVGVVLFTDPGDDGEVTEEKGVEKYPNGPARQPSSVQRGSTQFLSFAPGDPTTPGYPSKPGVPRGPTEPYIPSIPSIPISYEDALPILKALNGHGPTAKDFNKYWTADLGLEYKGVQYNIGPSPEHVVLHLYNEQEYIITPNWDVIGIINGSIADEVVIVGNHRDAWIVGGGGDPNSGSAVLNEVIRSFGEALQKGWKPLRTIVFASWDGEEYGLLGSTEWVEEYLPWLSHANVAYLNLDVSVRGQKFHASAAPLLDNLLLDITAQVQSPNQTVPGQTVYDTWDKKISTMGSGSDFTAFQDFAGIPSLDMGFTAGPEDPVYHYHSNYDSFHWMETYGDPGFIYHRTMAQILGLMTAKLADEPLLSFEAARYAAALDTYIAKVEAKLEAAEAATTALSPSSSSSEPTDKAEMVTLRGTVLGTTVVGDATAFRRSLTRLHEAVASLLGEATKLDAKRAELQREVEEEIPWWRWPSKMRLAYEVRKVNTKYKYLERDFLYPEGLDGRPWFKHVVFAPGLWTGYSGAVFPGLVESIDAKDYANAERWTGIIEECIQTATANIKVGHHG
ncbi:Zn-dependent exopeptidase [Cryphonectria parasitica EP155]|uniref:Zn-dependent exopeptidase n=1 Tax=Cryphonectria parasitica (strain ATCC 38755 / EP155) TaxID=660469 RepID=A0A9P5CMK7_CRYP1|nr:Zn-dependent exopeptidase [Cryphonectria parasitica EP155]KAF3764494.1 Zn-dependent exopeptidase [Cryphonectria parasitica EP155]